MPLPTHRAEELWYTARQGSDVLASGAAALRAFNSWRLWGKGCRHCGALTHMTDLRNTPLVAGPRHHDVAA